MDGYVFFEVDNMGNPIYGDKMKELLNCETEHILFILSAEYISPFVLSTFFTFISNSLFVSIFPSSFISLSPFISFNSPDI